MGFGAFAYLTFRPIVEWDAKFVPEVYILPNRQTQSTPALSTVSIRNSGLSAFDFFNFISQIGRVDIARWTIELASVTYCSKDDSYDVSTNFLRKDTSQRPLW